MKHKGYILCIKIVVTTDLMKSSCYVTNGVSILYDINDRGDVIYFHNYKVVTIMSRYGVVQPQHILQPLEAAPALVLS